MCSSDLLEQVAADAVVSYVEDRSGIRLVNCYDALGILHTSLMLDSTGNAQSNVQLRMYGLAGLTNLVVSGQPAGVDSSTGTANNAAEQASQLFSQLDAGLNVLGDTTAYRYNYLSAGQVNQLLSFLNDLENLGLDVSLGQLESYRLNNNSVSLSLVVLALLQRSEERR